MRVHDADVVMPRQRRLKVAGIFRLGLFEFDQTYGFVSLDTGKLLGAGDEHIELRVSDIYDAPRIAVEIVEKLGSDYVTQDWADMNRALYSALLLEKIAMGIGIGRVWQYRHHLSDSLFLLLCRGGVWRQYRRFTDQRPLYAFMQHGELYGPRRHICNRLLAGRGSLIDDDFHHASRHQGDSTHA